MCYFWQETVPVGIYHQGKMKTATTIRATAVLNELVFTTSRSSGPGGQHVNKVNSKVTLHWNIATSKILSEEQREQIIKRLRAKLTKDGILVLSAQDKRSQMQNKETVLSKLDILLKKALTPAKKRKPTKPTKAAGQKRILEKRKQGEKKQWRQKFSGQ